MIESVSSKELYEKFHEFYIAVIKHIICSITLTRDDGAAVDVEMLHRAQECCLEAFDELNYCVHYRINVHWIRCPQNGVHWQY